MPDGSRRQIIAVRSLAESDLGLFAAQRKGLPSKQRAVNINAKIARCMLSARLFDANGADFRCILSFGDATLEGVRPLRRVGKNWRLGGKKVSSPVFAALDSKDFMLIRTEEGNDGDMPLHIAFFSRNSDRVMQIGIAGVVERSLGQSMALFREGDEDFQILAPHCPVVRSALQPSDDWDEQTMSELGGGL